MLELLVFERSERSVFDLRDSHEDTSTRAERTYQVTHDGEKTNASTTESGRSGNDALELTIHTLITVTCHNQTLLLELLGDITWAGTRDFDPGLGESGTCDQHVRDEDSRMDGIEESILHVKGRRPTKLISKISRQADVAKPLLHVVDKARSRLHLGGTFTSLPNTDKLDQKVVAEARV